VACLFSYPLCPSYRLSCPASCPRVVACSAAGALPAHCVAAVRPDDSLPDVAEADSAWAAPARAGWAVERSAVARCALVPARSGRQDGYWERAGSDPDGFDPDDSCRDDSDPDDSAVRAVADCDPVARAVPDGYFVAARRAVRFAEVAESALRDGRFAQDGRWASDDCLVRQVDWLRADRSMDARLTADCLPAARLTVNYLAGSPVGSAQVDSRDDSRKIPVDHWPQADWPDGSQERCRDDFRASP